MTPGDRWYHQPVMWLGAVIFIAVLAGCINMVVLASRFPDEPVTTSAEQLFKMPETRPADAPR